MEASSWRPTFLYLAINLYNNTCILCVCVCLFVISEILGMKHSATLLTPSWKASRNELSQLFLEWTVNLV